MSDEMKGQIRALLTFAGGYFINQGWVDADGWSAISGFALFLIGSVWSWTSKKKKPQEPQENSIPRNLS